MHPGGNYDAEDSCLKDHNDRVAPVATANNPQPHDVEKIGMNSLELPAIGKSASITQPASLERGILNEPNGLASQDVTLNKNDDKDDFPEGGFRAWSVVLGSFCGSLSVFGVINCTAVFQEYFSSHQLRDHTESQIGWIFGFELFLTFFCGAPIGPIFDAYGPRALIFCGSILLVTSAMLLGLCTQYWHFIMAYSVLNGLGGSLINTPCIAAIGHFFLMKRGNATGVAMTSGSIGGVIFPLMLQKLIPLVGFAWSTRILGFILLILLILTNLLVRSRLPRKKVTTFKTVLPDLTAFKDIPFTLLTLGIFMLEWGVFVPLSYITSYVVSHGHSSSFGFQILSIMNGGSFFGRIFAGLIADMIGRMNTLILSIALCMITCFGLWLPAGESTAMIIVFSLSFGFASGSNVSLSPVCVGQMCKTENYGRYCATCWMVVAFGTLTGLPIAGQILVASGGTNYLGVMIFPGLAYAVAGLCLIAARVMTVGWRLNVIY